MVVRDGLVNGDVRFVRWGAGLGALEMVVPLMFPDADRRVALLYFARGMSFAERGEIEADTLFVSTPDKDLGVVGLPRLKSLVGSERYVDESRLSRLQGSTGRRKRERRLRIARAVKLSRGEMKLAGRV